MYEDIIKILNLERLNLVIDECYISKDKENATFYNLKFKEKSRKCIYCGQDDNVVIKCYKKKKIIHSISNVNKVFIILKQRQFYCKTCKMSFIEKNPIALENKNVSKLTDINILFNLKDHTRTFKSVAEQFYVSQEYVINLFDKAVSPSRCKLSEVICIDEFYTGKSFKNKYACTFLDFHSSKIIDIIPSRHISYLFDYLSKIPKLERINVKHVVIDMWDTYKRCAEVFFNNADISVDSFHVIEHLNKAMTDIRIKVMRDWDKRTNKLVDNDIYYYMLKKFHYFFTKDYEKIYDGLIDIPKTKNKWFKSEILSYLLDIDPRLKEAYYLKEKYREFNLTARYDTCDEEFEEIIQEFNSSQFSEFREFGKLLIHWKQEIKNSFIIHEGKRLSNASIEGVNNRIKTIVKTSNGIQNFNRLRAKAMYSINKNIPFKL